MGDQQLSASQPAGRCRAANGQRFGEQMRRQRPPHRNIEGNAHQGHVRKIAHRSQQKICVEGSDDNFRGTTIMVSSIRVLAVNCY